MKLSSWKCVEPRTNDEKLIVNDCGRHLNIKSWKEECGLWFKVPKVGRTLKAPLCLIYRTYVYQVRFSVNVIQLQIKNKPQISHSLCCVLVFTSIELFAPVIYFYSLQQAFNVVAHNHAINQSNKALTYCDLHY